MVMICRRQRTEFGASGLSKLSCEAAHACRQAKSILSSTKIKLTINRKKNERAREKNKNVANRLWDDFRVCLLLVESFLL